MAPLALGLMSGTSCDGISAALARFQDRRLTVLAQRTSPYSKQLAQRLRGAAELSVPALSALHVQLGELLAQAALRLLRQARCSPQRVAVIGSHGHTLYHGPRDAIPSTLQVGASAVIAERTGIPTVADFRSRDLAAGGEGAPLVPAFDQAFFGHGPARAMQNIGGIANVAVVGRGIRPIAFDTGPGNGLIDRTVQQATRGRQRFDTDGRLALQGRVDRRLVEQLWRHPYFRATPPKSTGQEVFNDALLQQVFGRRLQTHPYDAIATLTYFTAFSITESYRRFVPHRLREVIVSGGGVRNQTLMSHLITCAAPVPIRSIESYGIPSQAKEPVAFAYLALRALCGQPNHLPQTTGARHACILGSITPGNMSPV